MKRYWHIYSLTDPRTGIIRYVGVTFRGKQRFNEHLSRAVNGGKTHRDCWVRSVINLGLRPIYSLLETGTGDWISSERKWIARHRATITNHTDGGEGTPGIKPSAQLREKWSQMRAGVPYAPGRRSAMFGKTHTKAAREKIRRAGLGRHHTAESKEKLSFARRGKPLTKEHRKKLSEAHLGKTLTAEHRKKIAAKTIGKKPVVCVENGLVFPSITAASKTVGVTEASISQAIRKHFRCKGKHYIFQ